MLFFYFTLFIVYNENIMLRATIGFIFGLIILIRNYFKIILYLLVIKKITALKIILLHILLLIIFIIKFIKLK
jgi:membrane protein CcdC involved in cytochrome C biogenesis